MKTKIYLIILLISSVITHGQVKKKETLYAIYDFEKKGYVTDELKPKHKQPVVLKIININKIANSIEITSNDVKIKDDFLDSDEQNAVTIIASEKPAEEIVFEEVKLDLTIPSSVLTANDKNTSVNKIEIKNLNITLENIEKDINNLKNNIEKKQNLLEIQNNLYYKKQSEFEIELKNLGDNPSEELKNSTKEKFEKLVEPTQKKKEEISKEIEDFKNDLFNLQKDKKNIEKELNIKNDNIRNFKMKALKLAEKYNNFHSKIKDVNRMNSAYNSYIDFIINPNLTFEHYNNDAKLICIILRDERRQDYYSSINTIDEKYSEFVQEYNLFKNDNLFLESNTIDESYYNLVNIQMENLKIDADELYNKININNLRKKLNNVELINNVLSKENAFTAVSNPVQPIEDYLQFNVKIKQNKELGTSIIKEANKDFIYTEYIRQGVRWDVSVGTVVDFGIKNQEFEVQKFSENEFKIVENNTSQFTPTLAGILHTSFRSNSMFSFGLSLGLSIDVNKLNFNSFFPGVSLLIGKREKIVFTTGPSFKRVNQIKSIYKNDRILENEIQVTDITTEQFKIGYFFGITYNLTSKQKSKIKALN